MSTNLPQKKTKLNQLPNTNVKRIKRQCPPSYEIHYLNGALIDNTQQEEVVIGDLIQLQLVGKNGAVITNPVWTIDNHHVGGYTDLPNNPSPNIHAAQSTPTVLNQNNITFHWITSWYSPRLVETELCKA